MSVLLGLSCIVVSLWEKFAPSEYRGESRYVLMSVLLGLSCNVVSL